MKICGFYHVAMMNDWVSLANSQLLKLIQSGLLDASEYVYVSCVGPKGEFRKAEKIHPKIQLHHTNTRLQSYEHPTLQIMHETSRQSDFACYYLHTKGVSLTSYKKNKKEFDKRFNKQHQVKKFGHTNISKVLNNSYHWRLFLEYFIIERWQEAYNELKEYDCVGVNWRTEPFQHYGGNFWWSKSAYMRGLDDVYDFDCKAKYDRMRPEAWIGQKDDVRAKNLSEEAPSYFGNPVLPKTYRIKNTPPEPA